jgi:hypothetical protein
VDAAVVHRVRAEQAAHGAARSEAGVARAASKAPVLQQRETPSRSAASATR